MDFVTIGEYAEAKDRQRFLIREQQVDLSLGYGVSEKFHSRTSSVRVSGNVSHRWRLGVKAEATRASQYRPAEVVESRDVAANEDWVMSFIVE
jgi:hypothetical protein